MLKSLSVIPLGSGEPLRSPDMVSSALEKDDSGFLNPVKSSVICRERGVPLEAECCRKIHPVPAEVEEKEKGNSGGGP